MHAVKLQVEASSGIKSFSVVLETKSIQSCVVNFEDIQSGDNNSNERMELVQCVHQDVRLVFIYMWQRTLTLCAIL